MAVLEKEFKYVLISLSKMLSYLSEEIDGLSKKIETLNDVSKPAKPKKKAKPVAQKTTAKKAVGKKPVAKKSDSEASSTAKKKTKKEKAVSKTDTTDKPVKAESSTSG